MKLLLPGRLAEAAKEDAQAQIADSLEDRITAHLGPRPELNPTKHHLHAQMVRTLNQRAELADATDDLRRLESERANHAGTLGVMAGLIFTFLLEACGGYLVFKGLDRPFVEQLLLGGGMALGLLALTAVVSRPRGGEASSGSPPDRASRLLGVFTRVVYGVFVLALAIVRLREADEELGEVQQLAECCIMLACSIGPGFLGHYFIGRYLPIRRLNQELSLGRQRLSRLTKERQRAEQFLARLSARQVTYDEEAERLRAIYRTRHRLSSQAVRSLQAHDAEHGGQHEEA